MAKSRVSLLAAAVAMAALARAQAPDGNGLPQPLPSVAPAQPTAADTAAPTGATQATTPTGTTPARVVLPDTVTPSHYDLDVRPDAAAAVFAATVRIDVDVHRDTRAIELDAADLVFSQVSLSGTATAPAVRYDAPRQRAVLEFPVPVTAGHHVLSIAYTGRINADPAGLFYIDYDTPAGSRRALYTQFENSDARRFFPGWDEPNRKATFSLTVVAPAGQMAVSNMPAADAQPVPGGLVRTTFRQTPRMSSYLLFLGLGDFERITRRVNGVEVGVVVRRGDAAKGAFALDTAAQVLPYYEEYFGLRYPLPKLDIIAGPGQAQTYSAMENWGAIFGWERDFLVDPAISTEAERVDTYIDITHEIAHQWFGDLVTMDWWDDLWLNEGFASWMEVKSTDHFHPEWSAWLTALGERDAAMDLDSRIGTHAVVTPIPDVLQANSAFDDITYEKGMAVIRMLEAYVGEDAFRAGIRRYIRAHAYGNAVTADLWRELDRTSAAPVSRIARDFTLQAGVPLIRVQPGTRLRLTQERFATDASGVPTTWHVPVVVSSADGTGWRGIVSTDAPVTLPLPGVGTVINAGQTGYFRTLYPPPMIAALSARFASLAAADQLGLLEDAQALGLSGQEPVTDVLQLVGRVTPDMNPFVQGAAAEVLAAVARVYRGQRGEQAFRAWARPLLARLLEHAGWEGQAGESAGVRLLRPRLIAALSALDDPEVLARARALFSAHAQDPDGLPAELRSQVLSVVAAHADRDTWERIRALARSTHSPVEKAQYYELLAAAQDRTLAQAALDLALTDEIETTTRPDMLVGVAHRYPEVAFDFAVANLARVNAWLEPDERNFFQTQLLASSADPLSAARLRAFAAAHIPADARRPADAVAAGILYNAAVRARSVPLIDAWLQGAASRRPR